MRGIHCIIKARFENQKQRTNMRAREGKRARRRPPPGSSGFGPEEEEERGAVAAHRVRYTERRWRPAAATATSHGGGGLRTTRTLRRGMSAGKPRQSAGKEGSPARTGSPNLRPASRALAVVAPPLDPRPRILCSPSWLEKSEATRDWTGGGGSTLPPHHRTHHRLEGPREQAQ